MNRSLWLFPVFVFAAVFSSCGGNNDQAGNDTIGITHLDSVPDSLQQKYAHLVQNIPAPLTILEKLRDAGIKYRKEFLAPESQNNYAQTYQLSLNLGIQGADLAYAVTVGELADVTPRIRTVKKMADQLVVPSAFDDSTMNRYKNFNSVADTLRSLVAESYKRIDRSLQQNQRMGLAAMVVTGGWTESLYLATQHIGSEKENDKNKLVYDIVRQQKKHLVHLQELLADFKKDAVISGYAEKLKELESVYPSEQQLSPETLKPLAEKINLLRTNIIAGR